MKLFRKRRKPAPAPEHEALWQDSTADTHRVVLSAVPTDTEAWLERRGGSWEPAGDSVSDGLLIRQATGPDFVAEWGDTLHWDGEQITILR